MAVIGPSPTSTRVIGVEEEFLLVDPVTRRPEAAGARVVARAATTLGDLVSCEFSRYQFEAKTPPCVDVMQLRQSLLWLRTEAAAAAATEGLRICATGTPVVGNGVPAPVADHPRYHAGIRQYRGMLDDFAVCALHIHVGLADREVAVLTANHIRPWLPLLVALSANSPFHQGRDTGYADWRAVIRSRFPCLGPPPYVESLKHHNELAAAMAESGAMLDADTLFWDVRPNPRLPTLEIRAMDVVADVDDTVALAVLVRALVMTAVGKVHTGDAGPRPCSELLRAAYWRAARDGWSGMGVDCLTGQAHPVAEMTARLIEEVTPAMDECGDTQLVEAFVRRLSRRGAGAERQRASAARHGELAGVVDDLIALTAART